MTKPELSDRELLLLEAAERFGLSAVDKQYCRLGGHGLVPVRYHFGTLHSMRKKGVLEYAGYWKATELGRTILATTHNPASAPP